MESNRGQNGIQLLLAAEQEAQRIVNAARAGNYLCWWLHSIMFQSADVCGIMDMYIPYMACLMLFYPRVSETLIYLLWSLFSAKLARLKQAKEEAEKEIAEFRAQMDAQFQRKVSERLEKETEGKIHHLKNEAGRISQDVVQMLLRQVTTVKN
ncbi:hypothetical protein C3L33_14656, partial [Rhododendron williamsianum]